MIQAVQDVLTGHKFVEAWPDKMNVSKLGAYLAHSTARVWGGKTDDDDKDFRGVIAGFVAPDFHSGLLYGIEYLWAVREKSGALGLNLYQEFEKACKAAGCKRIVMGLFFGASRNDFAVRKLYQRMGFKPLSASYSKTI